MRASNAFSQIYGIDAPDEIVFGRAKGAAGTDFLEIYLSYKTDLATLAPLNLNRREPTRDYHFNGGNDAPQWWRGNECDVELILEPKNPGHWDENLTILCSDGWYYAYGVMID